MQKFGGWWVWGFFKNKIPKPKFTVLTLITVMLLTVITSFGLTNTNDILTSDLGVISPVMKKQMHRSHFMYMK